MIPKTHAAKLTDVPDSELEAILPVAKKVATAIGCKDYNVLQNNGRIAHQLVDHVHFHVIPKPDEKQGLGIAWPAEETDIEKVKKVFEEVKAKM